MKKINTPCDTGDGSLCFMNATLFIIRSQFCREVVHKVAAWGVSHIHAYDHVCVFTPKSVIKRIFFFNQTGFMRCPVKSSIYS